MQKIKRILSTVPKTFWIILALALAAWVIQLIANAVPSFADAVGGSVSHALRGVLAYLTALLPFSLAELFILGIPIWILLLVLLARRMLKKGKNAVRLCCGFLAVLPIVYILFVFSMGMGYASSPLEERLSLDTGKKITAEELFDTSLWLAEEANRVSAEITFAENGESIMPYDRREMNRKLIEAYKTLCERYDFVNTFSVGVKPVLMSHAMSYTGITGVYSFFTGEANLNTAYPDFSNAYTAAHEMAHARGIARENEANFIAFLVLECSDDAYLNYAAYTNLLQYVMNALARTDKELFRTLYASLSDTVKNEFKAYNDFVSSVNDHPVRDVAESVNNAYLQGVGTEGTVSYSLVVNLAVAYHREK